VSRRRRSRGLIFLIAIIFLVLIAEAGLVAFVFISPSANERLTAVAADVGEAWAGTDEKPGIRTKGAEKAHDAYENWILPLWQADAIPTVDPEFTACVECHKEYATQRRFSVYMNHPLHAELGMRCVECHPTNPHPNPPRPQENACADCHSEVNDKDQCGYCHPPASLPHFYYLGTPKESVVDCSVCHPKNSFAGQPPEPKISVSFSGSNEATCLACHEKTTCAVCHTTEHPPDWLATHGSQAAFGGSSCSGCHTVNWCSDRCHAVTDLNPLQPRPLPSVGVRP
jgi:hypothetical protein